MQLLDLQLLHRVYLCAHPSQAVPAASHSLYLAHLTASFAPSRLEGTRTVLLALTSLVTVDGLTPVDFAMDRAESPLPIPSWIASLIFSSMCLPFESRMANPFPAGARANEMLGESLRPGGDKPRTGRRLQAPLA